MAILRDITPLVEPLSLDEAFLDVAGARRLLGEAPEIAQRLRGRIADELGLTASVGVARIKLLAKLASEAAKPIVGSDGTIDPGRGVVVIDPDHELAFLHPLPVRALWGVGPATEKRLDRYGVRTVRDLAALPKDTLVGALGQHLGRHLHELAWCRDERSVIPVTAAKSIGHEETYARDLVAAADLQREVIRLSDAVATRLRRAGLAARTITIKVRSPDMQTITRARTLAEPTDLGPDIAREAARLLAAVDTSGGVRLFGISCSHLGPPPEVQLSFDDILGGDPRTEAARAVEEIRKRFGDRAVGPATLVRHGEGVQVKRTGDAQWGPRGTA
jgi:DNA polymerase-4